MVDDLLFLKDERGVGRIKQKFSKDRLFVAKILFAKSKPAGLLRCVNLIANCCHRKMKKKKELENAKEE